ncbi:hypothetical protein Alches_18810 [Alicyclobacillus hesperidum subsp. aegles]|nr:hypothetical protein Alches_18810 [Alicyclobacillus hesperidum subsp. aegles]
MGLKKSEAGHSSIAELLDSLFFETLTQAAKGVTMLFAAVMAALILPNYAL